jgi:hypothetical protein
MVSGSFILRQRLSQIKYFLFLWVPYWQTQINKGDELYLTNFNKGEEIGLQMQSQNCMKIKFRKLNIKFDPKACIGCILYRSCMICENWQVSTFLVIFNRIYKSNSSVGTGFGTQRKRKFRRSNPAIYKLEINMLFFFIQI